MIERGGTRHRSFVVITQRWPIALGLTLGILGGCRYSDVLGRGESGPAAGGSASASEADSAFLPRPQRGKAPAGSAGAPATSPEASKDGPDFATSEGGAESVAGPESMSPTEAGQGGQSQVGGTGKAGSAGSAGSSSAGCGKQANQALDEWVRYTVTAREPEMMLDLEREYFVRLPPTYDRAKPYRLMFTFPFGNGKGDTGTSPLYNAPGADAIFVGPSPDESFWVYTADSKDVAFFDAMLTVLEANFCVDQHRIFASGFSSGSWFTHVLGCQRSNILRAQGNIAGSWPTGGRLDPAICAKQSLAGILIHDQNDATIPIAGGMMARDRLLTLNGCTTETRPVEPAPCVEYVGCKSGYPVVWCQTQGQGHSRQDALSVPALYNFFAQF